MELPRPAVVVALLTPYDDAGAPDRGALRAHVDLLVEAGVDALMPCGTTGEGPLLGDDEVRAHYGALVEGAGAPVYAYTIPSHTHRELEPELLEQLAGDGLAGMKDSTKSPARHRAYQAAATPPFALFTGTAGLMLDALRGGSAGAVLAVANVHPETCVALAAAVRDGRDEEAERRQAELVALEDRLRATGGIPAFKRALADRLADRGSAYSTAVRGPLAAPASVPAAAR